MCPSESWFVVQTPVVNQSHASGQFHHQTREREGAAEAARAAKAIGAKKHMWIV